MRKARLATNILPKAKQRLLIDGLSGADILYITRDVISMAVGVIELEDQTKVPGGRTRATEFTVTLQLANDEDRKAFFRWRRECIDIEGRGISPNYKRNGTVIFLRLHQGDNPVRVRLIGLWPSEMKIPDYDMNADEGDGDCRLEITLQCDDIDPEEE